MNYDLLAQAQKQSNPAEMVKTIAIFVVFYAIFYVIILRPQKKKVQAHKQRVASLVTDDQVILEGGIYGSVKAIEDGILQIEIAEKTVVKVDQNAVRSVVNDSEKK
ncbi:preprotein translocase subunit YajC [Lentisphaera profundi]|uniref:Sec translocon accessory complex subunit YajC n=1 Tax=Lentisphaera profundi TaxID=1658616 RepID=A0ABY7VNY7_9BACT|nr:preprotein translocase subunit YajC [Lentisphaera profundi]WDE95850.1 preprotein translocase subunit YajC [Lentisphaera profundi]